MPTFGNTPIPASPATVLPVCMSDDCRAVHAILARVGDKWSMLAVAVLGQGPRRFNETKRLIGGISQRMLTLTLHGLERDGLVLRTVTPSNPPRVDYALTDLGHSLSQPVEALGDWARADRVAVEQARSAFDRKTAAEPVAAPGTRAA